MYMSRSPLFCMFLAIIVATTPSVAVAAEGFDPALLSKDTVAAGLAFPNRMLHAPGMELFPHEIAKVASLEQMGIDLTTIEQVQLAVEKFAPGIPPNFGVKIVFQQPVDLDSFVERAGVPTKPVEYKGTTYQQIDQPSPISIGFYQPQKRVVVWGTGPVLRRMIDGTSEGNQAIANALLKQGTKNDAMVIFSLDPMRPLIQLGMAQSPPLPPQLEQFKKIPDLISMAILRLNVAGEGPSGLTIASHDAGEAEELEKLILKAMEIGKAQMFAKMAQDPGMRKESPAMQQATQAYMQRITDSMLSAFVPTRKGKLLTIEQEGGIGGLASAQMNLPMIGILVALLLPALAQVRAAARASTSKANMKGMMLALMNYQARKGRFPGRAIVDENGKPLLSWRVGLLWDLEAGNLAEQFHFDEPWDSPHNIKLLDQMPPIFKSPNSTSTESGNTNYVLAVGQDTAFPNFKPVRQTRASSLTIALVEVDDAHAVPWTKPDDYDVKNLPKGLAGGAGLFNVANFDGSVCSLPIDLDGDLLKALFSADHDQHGAMKAQFYNQLFQ